MSKPLRCIYGSACRWGDEEPGYLPDSPGWRQVTVPVVSGWATLPDGRMVQTSAKAVQVAMLASR